MGEITMVDDAPTKPSSAMLMTMQDELVLESQGELSVALDHLKNENKNNILYFLKYI